ncbi:MAG TPA: hypothetical protein VL284_04315 [Thermoanaerobaculia bacterium]|nr:hypothetical protein [Thermoanaerobaculia bacterium]
MENEALWIPVISITGSFVMVVMIVWFASRGKQRKAELRAEVQMKLIDKFGNASEFVQFLESPAGKQFLDQPRQRTRERALGNITGALVCTFIGLAFTACAIVFRDAGFMVPGFILLGIGIALFISSAISWKLDRQSSVNPPAAMP